MRVQIPAARREVLDALQEHAEAWGAEWRPDGWGGRLRLPVTAGVRHGVVEARLSVEDDREGSRLRIEVEESHYVVHRSAVTILALGAAGGVTVMLWPFFPVLGELAGIGALLLLLAWFLVGARLRNSGLEEFFEHLAAQLRFEAGDEDRPPDPAVS